MKPVYYYFTQVSKSSSTLPGSVTLPELKSTASSSSAGAAGPAEPPSTALTASGVQGQEPHHNPDGVVSELIEKFPPPGTTKLGSTTETVKRTTYTETTVKRVTNNRSGVTNSI